MGIVAKWIPVAVALVSLVAPLVSAQLQAWYASHAAIVTTYLGLLAIANAFAPQPHKPTPEPPKPPAPPAPPPVFVFMLALCLALVGCGYGKPVCTIIDAAHDACAVVRYLGPHGALLEVRVPRSELEALARAEAAKQAAGQCDAGSCDGGVP